jgi:asparagine synthase (glutamine-hydrolysing)
VSAVAGIIQFDGAPLAPDGIERMTAAMTARGPHGISHWSNGSVAVGHCALRSTPESLTEVQPLVCENGTLTLVMDGCVDNRDDVRRDLEADGIVLRDASDAELVLKAYERWGEESAGRIIGELVFLVWDSKRRSLFGARDAAGTRHVHYYAGDGWFAFASDINGLLALARIAPELNESRLLDYLVDEFDRDDEVGTFYRGISRLPAGHAIRVTEHGARTWRYWNPDSLSELRFSSLDDCAEAFAAQLQVVLKSRLRANGSIGVQLSGGLDSSSIVAVIDKDLRRDLTRPLKTFSLVREDRDRCPEWQSVRRVVERGCVDSHVITPRVVTDAWRGDVDGLTQWDQPAVFTDGYTDFLLCRAARDAGCRVVLDGTAGDLLFYSFRRSLLRSSGWEETRAVLEAARRHGQPRMWRTLVGRASWAITPEPIKRVGRRLRPLFWRPGLNIKLLHRDVARRLVAERLLERRRRHAVAPMRSDISDHASSFMSGLLSYAHEVNGQIALAAGIEPRSPYSDRRMIEFAIRMPREAKLSAGWYKWLLRRSMSRRLPPEVVWRRDVGMHPGGEFRKQLIFGMSTGAPEIWNRADLESKLSPWIDARRLRRAWRAHERTGNLETGGNLLLLVVSAHWMGARFGRIPSSLRNGT